MLKNNNNKTYKVQSPLDLQLSNKRKFDNSNKAVAYKKVNVTDHQKFFFFFF